MKTKFQKTKGKKKKTIGVKDLNDLQSFFVVRL